jgi:hypothetical protein
LAIDAVALEAAFASEVEADVARLFEGNYQ